MSQPVPDDLTLRRERGARWLPVQPVTTLDGAGAFVAEHGLTLVFPAERTVAPSLWEAVAGEDAEPFATGMGEAESRVWAWKDELPRHGLAWSGKFLYRRASLLSPHVLGLLYPGRGLPDDHRALELTREAHELADALASGPLPTSALRQLAGHRSRYDRAIGELHRCLLVSSAGTMEQRSGWPAVLIDLTCRLFDVGTEAGPAQAAQCYLQTALATTPRELSRAFGWTTVTARRHLDELVSAGTATQAGSTYLHLRRS